jgi:formylglycine-generating enzyme required for sulfatase activity
VSSVALIALALAVAGCGASTDDVDASPPNDASAADADTPLPDGSAPPEGCAEPGEMRTVDCGRCGIASQVCGDDGLWQPPSECFSEGECAAGEIERDTSMCGERARICDGTCAWLDWEEMTPPGECEAGATERFPSTDCAAGELAERTCSSSCAWEAPACVAGCVRSPMASLTGADPVCIPAGAFELGSSNVLLLYSRPMRTITLSEFYIDRFPVTKARYDMCRSAGGCVDPMDLGTWAALNPDDYAIGMDFDASIAFCAWDGGAAPTEFQWEKAARGPSPDVREHSWGTDGGRDCRFHPWVGCTQMPFAVTDFPMATSPYGIQLLGSMPERTGSRWVDYDVIPDTDPTGSTDPADYYVGRGVTWVTPRGGGSYQTSSITFRFFLAGTYDQGFRCAY